MLTASVGRRNLGVVALSLVVASISLSGAHRTALEEEVVISEPGYWSNEDNVNTFLQLCVDGNQEACDEIVKHDEALAILNNHATIERKESSHAARGKSDFQSMGDRMVPLAQPIPAKTLSQGDLGFYLEGHENVWEDARAARRQGLRLVVPGGRANQLMLERLAITGVPDRCAMDGPNCGPTRPEKDYGADIELPGEGFLGIKYECCPCLGRGAQRIGYDQYDSAGSYNPYTMNLCKSCGC